MNRNKLNMKMKKEITNLEFVVNQFDKTKQTIRIGDTTCSHQGFGRIIGFFQRLERSGEHEWYARIQYQGFRKNLSACSVAQGIYLERTLPHQQIKEAVSDERYEDAAKLKNRSDALMKERRAHIDLKRIPGIEVKINNEGHTYLTLNLKTKTSRKERAERNLVLSIPRWKVSKTVMRFFKAHGMITDAIEFEGSLKRTKTGFQPFGIDPDEVPGHYMYVLTDLMEPSKLDVVKEQLHRIGIQFSVRKRGDKEGLTFRFRPQDDGTCLIQMKEL